MEKIKAKWKKMEMEDTFIESHDGHIIKNGGNGIRNSYQIWKDQEGKKYVKMKILQNGEELYTFYDHEFLDEIKDRTYYITNGYAMSSSTKRYLHHLVMDFESRGRGFQDISIDHKDRDKLDNRKSNLREATAKEQQENSEGRIEGTKKNRQSTAVSLPEDITQKQIPKYVSYRVEKLKEYFIIEDHPVYMNGITINGKHIGQNIKSIQAKWIDQYAKTKIPYPIIKKLEEITAKCEKLNEIYKLYKETLPEDKNIVVDEEYAKDLLEIRTAKNTKTVYKYDELNNLVEEYDSIVNAANANSFSENTARRAIKSEKLCQGFYYKTVKM